MKRDPASNRSYLSLLSPGYLFDLCVWRKKDQLFTEMSSILSTALRLLEKTLMGGSQRKLNGLGWRWSQPSATPLKIQTIISTAENMWIKDENLKQDVKELLMQLKDTAYDADDLLHEFRYQILRWSGVPTTSIQSWSLLVERSSASWRAVHLEQNPSESLLSSVVNEDKQAFACAVLRLSYQCPDECPAFWSVFPKDFFLFL